MSQTNILVVGAGNAGSVAAYWLGKAGINVTVIERAEALRTSGQGVDLRGRALDVVRLMSLEDEIKTLTTEEAGLVFVDDNNRDLATLNVEADKSFTAEIEIIRSDLAKILYRAALSTGNVNFRFDVHVSSLRQNASSQKVDVGFRDGQSQEYDLLIAADGFGSKSRTLILGPDEASASIRSLDAFVAYFTTPSRPQDSPHSRWFMTTRRRAATLRPKSTTETSAYLTVFSDSAAPRLAASSNDIDAQKLFVTQTFADVGWEVPRMLQEMQHAGPDDFYFQETGQIILPPSSWHQGRCVLVGDAAYCPSAFTGMGTSLAVIGSYVLAGEIVAQVKKNNKSKEIDLEVAFKNYEDRLGAYVQSIQKLPLGGKLVSFLNPEGSWHLWLLRNILWLADRSGLVKAMSFFGGAPDTEGLQLPEYQF